VSHRPSAVVAPDLSDYYPSVEWDILEIPARRVQKVYKTCCPRESTFIDITVRLP